MGNHLEDAYPIRAAINSIADELPNFVEKTANQKYADFATIVVCKPGSISDQTSILNIKPHQTLANLGGAGGYAYAILAAIADGAEWVWLMDDDAEPETPEVLSILLQEALERELNLVSPVIVASDNPKRLAFPFRNNGKLCYDRDWAVSKRFFPNIAHLFNGALIHKSVFFEIGIPDTKLFIRGDEVDFLLRLRKAKIAFGTTTKAAVLHPSGESEVEKIVADRHVVLIPETEFKRYFFFRNRGYLARRHRRLGSLFADLFSYPIAFLVKRRMDTRGLSFWWNAFNDGLRCRFDKAPAFLPNTRKQGRNSHAQ